mgnify:CR=1 FL=1
MSKRRELSELTRRYARAVYESGALLIREEPFTLRSGRKSHLYINHREFLSSSANIRLMAELYQELLRIHVGECTVAAVDSIMSPVLCGAITILGGENVVSVRPTKLEHGTEEQVYGSVSGRVAMIDDMTSSGGTILAAAKVLRARGHEVSHAIVSVVRDKSLEGVFAAEGLSLAYVATLPQLAAEVPTLTARERELLSRESDAP